MFVPNRLARSAYHFTKYGLAQELHGLTRKVAALGHMLYPGIY